MSTTLVRMSLLVILLTSCGSQPKPSLIPMPSSLAVSNQTLELLERIPLTGVEGRIDHLSIDLEHQRLFVAALGNNSVEILDLRNGKLIHSITALSEPQGVLYISDLNRLCVANGGNGLLEMFDASSFTELGRVELSGDADNIRYDPKTQAVVVGYGDGGLSFVAAGTGKVLKNIKLDAHPESFQLDPAGSKIFVNIPSADQIAVVDPTGQKVTATWFMTYAAANYPMALDAGDHRLFVGFRFPARLGVIDTDTEKLVAGLDTTGDVDDIFYDAAHKIVFAIGGEGRVDLFSQQDADHYRFLAQVPTAAGARTGLWVPEQSRLYVAVPHQGAQEAQVQVYQLQP